MDLSCLDLILFEVAASDRKRLGGQVTSTLEEGGLTSSGGGGLLERRLGKMIHRRQLRIMVDRLNEKQHQLHTSDGVYNNSPSSRHVAPVVTPSMTMTSLPVGEVINRKPSDGRHLSAAGSPSQSPNYRSPPFTPEKSPPPINRHQDLYARKRKV